MTIINKFGDFDLGLSYDDILLKPCYSATLPSDTDVSTKFSRNISMALPITSAAMDTITDGQMAVAIAQAGGIGVIHKNFSVSEQAEEVRRVKRKESGMISEPITTRADSSISDLLSKMQTHGVSGVPVIEERDDGCKILVGIVTGRDLALAQNRSLGKTVADIMTKKVITVPLGVTQATAAEILYEHRIEKLPVLDNKGCLVGLYTLRDIQNAENHPLATKDENGRFRVAAAVGVGQDAMNRVKALTEVDCDAIVIDTAHGFSKGVADLITWISKEFRDREFDLVVGNIATVEAAHFLRKQNIDAMKIGMGPGSICTTRIIAGIGVPQFSAILSIANEVKGEIPLIADGGIRYSGDIAKALAAGADSVMIGSLLAGTDEAPGDLEIYQGKTYKSYRGMGSWGAMVKGSRDRYGQADVREFDKLVPEGIEGRVAYRGPLKSTLQQLVGGLQSSMGYLGAENLRKFRENATFIRISPSAMKESHVHDVYITKEAPNYRS